MLDLTSEIRPLWMKGINELNGRTPDIFIDWVNMGRDYVVYDQVETDKFELYITDQNSLYKALGGDINRFGMAAFESINEIHYNEVFPKSNAWKCIKAYYGAYYAAHAFLRMMGDSCTNFEDINTRKIESIADAYGVKNGININGGYYSCHIDSFNSKILCNRLAAGKKKGSHEQLWKVFLDKINFIISEIGSRPTNIDRQNVITRLLDLVDNLTYMGHNGGNWLSKVRNDISYKHLYGLWHPYSEFQDYYIDVETILGKWKQEAGTIDINIYSGKMILRFVSTCIFIITLFKDLAIDMSNRCSKGHSFLSGSVLSFYNKAIAN